MTLYTRNDFKMLFSVEDEVFAWIEVYQALLVKWNKAINLVSPKTIPESWHRHIIDSAQVTQYVPDDAHVYADLGCGAGFPGLVVAMMKPGLDVHLVESDERKCQFMRTVVREAGLTNVTIHTKRIEQSIGDITPDFVTARALASLDNLFAYCLPWAEKNPSLCFGFMKGERAEEEIEAARKQYDFNVSTHQSITDAHACILSVSALRHRT